MSAGIVAQGSWIVMNSKQVRQRMTHMTKQGLGSTKHQTYDFTTMYPSLSLDSLKHKMKQYSSLMFQWAFKAESPANTEKVLVIKYKGSNKNPWRQKSSCHEKNTPSQQVVTKARFDKWVEYLIDNLYVQVGDKLLQQNKGLPMGTSCSPWLANIMLFMYEFEYFSTEISKLKPCDINSKSTAWLLLRDLSFCTRYIDDLWNPRVDRNTFEEIVKKMYPAESGLELGEPEHDTQAVDYLDMTIWFDNISKQWHSKLYDKKLDLVKKGLKLNKFPDPTSKLSSRCKYGVITSQLHRYNVACTTRSAFIEPARVLYRTYLEKGYLTQKVNQYFTSFLRRYVPHYQPGKALWDIRRPLAR